MAARKSRRAEYGLARQEPVKRPEPEDPIGSAVEEAGEPPVEMPTPPAPPIEPPRVAKAKPCRHAVRRLVWSNELKVWQRKCDDCGAVVDTIERDKMPRFTEWKKK